MDDLFELLQYADPETRQAMIDAGLAPMAMGVQQQAGAMGGGLASTPTPEGRNVGHTYVASSPLEHLSAAIRQGVGMGMQRGAMQNEQDQIGKIGKGRNAYLDLLGRYGQGAQSQQPQPVQAPQMIGMAGPPNFDGSY